MNHRDHRRGNRDQRHFFVISIRTQNVIDILEIREIHIELKYFGTFNILLASQITEMDEAK
jgi:hypothetical protein